MALALHVPLESFEKHETRSNSVPVFSPQPTARVSLGNITSKPSRTISIPARYRSRVIAKATYTPPNYQRSPRPSWPRMSRKRSSEELLDRAMRELAKEMAEHKRKAQQKVELDIVPMEEIAEEVAPEPIVTEDPLAHLPAIRRRPDINASGTAFTVFGFRPFKSDWTDVVYRQFKAPGLI